MLPEKVLIKGMNIEIQPFKTDVGELILAAYRGRLCMADWRYRKKRDAIDHRLQRGLQAAYVEQDCEVLRQTRLQLNQYFAGERKIFDIPLLLVGTAFQKSVWHALMQIPYGETSSYLKLAENIDNRKAVRAVANANGANAISIIIPCHRIIGSDGALVGYAGGLKSKKKLLEQEGVFSNKVSRSQK